MQPQSHIRYQKQSIGLNNEVKKTYRIESRPRIGWLGYQERKVVMNEEHEKQLSRFPLELRQLVAAELSSGNSIVSFESGFPAPPCGALLRLAQPVQAERRVSSVGVTFCDHVHLSSHSGEFTTAERHFFVLEPPRALDPILSMEEIREELKAKERAEDERRFRDTYY